MKAKHVPLVVLFLLILLLIYQKSSPNTTRFAITADTNVSQIPGLSKYVTQEEVRSFGFRYWDIDGNYTKDIPSNLIPLRKLLKQKDTDKILSYLHEHNLSLDVRIQEGTTPLMYSSFYDDLNTSKILIQKGANVRAKDRFGLSPLAYAIENNSTLTAKLLVNSGVKFEEIGVKSQRRDYGGSYKVDNVIQSYFTRPTHYVAENKIIIDGYKVSIEYADPYIKDRGSDGENFFEYIVNQKYIELAKLVLESGYKPTLLNGDLDYDSLKKHTISKSEFNYNLSVYSAMYSGPNYKPMLNLLLKYKVPGIPDENLLKQKYKECYEIYKGLIIEYWHGMPDRKSDKKDARIYNLRRHYGPLYPVFQKYCPDENGTFEVREFFDYRNEYEKTKVIERSFKKNRIYLDKNQTDFKVKLYREIDMEQIDKVIREWEEEDYKEWLQRAKERKRKKLKRMER